MKKMLIMLLVLLCTNTLSLEAGLRSSLKNAYSSTKESIKSGYESTKNAVVSGYTSTKEAVTSGYEKLTEKLSDFKQDVARMYTEALEGVRSSLATHSHAKEIAQVRVGNTLSEQEQNFLRKRRTITRNAIRRMFPELDLADDEIPTVAFVESGGGFRAMIETAGALAGAEKTGFINTFSYMGGLSGSTWYINPLVASGQQPIAYLETLIQNLKKAPYGRDLIGIRLPSTKELYHLARDVSVKAAYGQPVNILDIYGFLLANELLSSMPSVKDLGQGKKQGYKMSDLGYNLQSAGYPLPISTAIEVSESPTIKWFEFTPFDIGSYHTGMQAYVPTWGFGRKFNNGTSVTAPPELTLGFLMGICGSAFAIDFWGIMHEIVGKLSSILPEAVYRRLEESLTELKDKVHDAELQEEHREIMTGARIFSSRKDRHGMVIRKLTGGKTYNFTTKMPGQRMSGFHNMILVDGGHEIKKLPHVEEWDRLNLGAMPLLRPERQVDLLIMCDASGGTLGTALAAVAARAEEDKLPFPRISKAEYEAAGNNLVSVFGEHNPKVPTVVYIPGTLDAKARSFSGTLNFKYSEEQIRYLAGITRNQFEQSAPTIKKALYDTIMKKRMQKNQS